MCVDVAVSSQNRLTWHPLTSCFRPKWFDSIFLREETLEQAATDENIYLEKIWEETKHVNIMPAGTGTAGSYLYSHFVRLEWNVCGTKLLPFGKYSLLQ